MKFLNNGYLDLQEQSSGSTFTLFYVLLKKASRLHTAKIRSNRTVSSLWSKMSNFRGAWHRLKVLPCPSHYNSKVPTDQVFQMRYCRILYLKVLWNGQRSKLKLLSLLYKTNHFTPCRLLNLTSSHLKTQLQSSKILLSKALICGHFITIVQWC